MTIRPNIYLLIGTILVLLTWLFVGIYRDDEFNEQNLFLKHRPTFQMNFHTQIGMQDLTVDKLSEDEQASEMAFQEFITARKVQNNNNTALALLPFIMIQFSVSFLYFGLYKPKLGTTHKKWQLPLHFVLCLFITSLGLSWILWSNSVGTTVLGGLIILAINYSALFLITKKSR